MSICVCAETSKSSCLGVKSLIFIDIGGMPGVLEIIGLCALCYE